MKNRVLIAPSLAAVFLPVIVLLIYANLYPGHAADEYDDNLFSSILGFVILLTVSGGHVLFLGLPTFLVLSRVSTIRWWTPILVGFLLGSLPIGVLSWPARTRGITAEVFRGTTSYPTLENWADYIQSLSFFGLLGAVAGAAFWASWLWTSRD